MFLVLKDFFKNLFKLWLYYWSFVMIIILIGFIGSWLVGVFV